MDKLMELIDYVANSQQLILEKCIMIFKSDMNEEAYLEHESELKSLLSEQGFNIRLSPLELDRDGNPKKVWTKKGEVDSQDIYFISKNVDKTEKMSTFFSS
tara:strand:- start:222 stop:524 length:303 start_codon:yes stop_codon:yes gene_type:complete